MDIAGDAWLVRHLAAASGLEEELRRVFGEVEGGALAGLAAHQFVTGHGLYRAEAWLSQREVPETWRGPLASESAVHGFVARVGADAARMESPRHAFLYGGTPLRHVVDTWRQDEATLTAHLFFDPGRHAESTLRIEKHVFGLVERAARVRFGNWREAKAWIAENAGGRAACLRVANGEEGTPRIVPKPKRLAATTARAGYTLVLARGREPAGETAEAVLRDYRARDLAEKLFDAFKTEHGQYRLRTASDEGVQGRFFLGFVTLALRAELERRMHAANLHKSMTDANVLDELGKAKTLVTRKGTRILLEVSKKQRELLAALKVPELA